MCEYDRPERWLLSVHHRARRFVGIKIIDESAIPVIPDSIVLLMGLSNVVYVPGKYIGNS
jgi:hypothetical protein